MARRTGPSKKVILNREALTEFGLGVADGMGVLGAEIARQATSRAPDEDPKGLGLIQSAGWGVWLDGKKVGGGANKPRSAKLGPGIVLLVGFPFPARFNEIGTIDQAARPFLLPSIMEKVGLAEKYVGPSAQAAVDGRRIQAAYDRGDVAAGQDLNREIGMARGGSASSGGAMKD